ncbi:helix-turn-helix domain-containing protein [Streptomyces sp. NPDC017941]|uniref:helix-turn-helix domain-containing protein n=1 Tax=unclassified Streptomyces TaxID=2593676 RepID=UPI0037AB02D3
MPGDSGASRDLAAGGDQAHFARLLHHVRHYAGVTTSHIAHTTGADPGHIHDVLAGRCFPSRTFALRYARACGADPQILLMAWQREHDRRAH